MRLLLTYECVCLAQVDSKLASLVTCSPENSSVGGGESEISSLTDPTYGPVSMGEADPGVNEDAIVVADAVFVHQADGGSESGVNADGLSSPSADDRPSSVSENDDDSSSWSWSRTSPPPLKNAL